MAPRWQPLMNPETAREWEIDILEKYNTVVARGFLYCNVPMIKLRAIVKHGFESVIRGQFAPFTPKDKSEVTLLCQFVLTKDKDGACDEEGCSIFNPKAIVIIGYFREYKTPDKKHGWTPVKSVRDAQEYNKFVPLLYAYHGTSDAIAAKILRDGFRTMSDLEKPESADALGNYFTPFPWYAALWAKAGKILVCQLKFTNPMSVEEFMTVWNPTAEHYLEKEKPRLLRYIKEKGYNGMYNVEPWSWDPTNVIVVGEIVPAR